MFLGVYVTWVSNVTHNLPEHSSLQVASTCAYIKSVFAKLCYWAWSKIISSSDSDDIKYLF